MYNTKDVAVHFRTAADYRAAISSLETSTRAIEDQIDASRGFLNSYSLQHDASKTLHRPHVQSEQQKQISSLINTLRNDIQYGHRSSSDKLQKKLSTTFISTADVLRRHDYQLEQLDSQQHTAAPTELDDGDDHEQNLLETLHHTHSEIIRTRLDRIYLDSCTSASVATNGDVHEDDNLDNSYETYDVSQSKLDDVQFDLRSLHAEIDDVAQMLVMHEHGDQLLAARDRRDETRQYLSDQQARQAVERLTAMTDQLEELSAYCEMLQSQRVVQHRLEASLQSVKGPEMPRQALLGPQVDHTGGKQNGPAIAALRQYLGLGDDVGTNAQRDGRVKQAFEEYVTHVQTVLEIQTKQSNHLQPDQIRGEKSEEAVPHILLFPGSCKSRLDALDEEIEAIKTRMEELRT